MGGITLPADRKRTAPRTGKTVRFAAVWRCRGLELSGQGEVELENSGAAAVLDGIVSVTTRGRRRESSRAQ